MIDKRIGERIKQCREQLGLTQEQFAERLGLTTNYISTSEYRSGILSEELKELPAEEQQRILEIVELMIKQAKKKMD